MPPEFLLRALSNAGSTLHSIGLIPRALDLYVRAYEAAQLDESAIAQTVMLINVGSIYSEELESYDAAEQFFEQADEIISRSDLPEKQTLLLHLNRGMNHLRAGRDRDALIHFDAAAQLGDDDDYTVRRARAERVAVQARLAGGGTASAMAELQRIVDLQAASGDRSGAAITRLRMSRLALDDGAPDVARAHAEHAMALVGTTRLSREYSDAVRAKIAALRAARRFEEALDVQDTLLRSEVRNLRSQNLDSLAGLQAKLLDQVREREIVALREARQVEALNLMHTRWLRNAALICAIVLAVLMLAFWWYQRRVNRRLHHLGSTDGLTGLENRGAAMRRLGATPLPARPALRNAVFLIDVDHFKQCNDRYGHATGDAILVQIAARLAECCRPGDLVARWGGEEFVVACPGIELRAATEIAERLRNAIGNAPFEIDEVGAVPLSISLGFACWPFLPGVGASRGGWQDAVDLADRALYASKRGGRAAWTGLWGGDATTDATIVGILRDPEGAIASGAAAACSSRAQIHWGAGEAEVAADHAPDHAPA
ncbi:diguanylate cyclase [Luteimonas terrae]|uniref:diguanylate cyclase n=1 Tax=Luteimonas terrae TaxID=1530191 RepID=A0ABU1XUN2_9GAMM|nr:diguanylate cyclase [Luteimonas terrae]MDR7192474.1 diguanylate cyclase (GGDEF)-like protein [Luteimonas terrae]